MPAYKYIRNVMTTEEELVAADYINSDQLVLNCSTIYEAYVEEQEGGMFVVECKDEEGNLYSGVIQITEDDSDVWYYHKYANIEKEDLRTYLTARNKNITHEEVINYKEEIYKPLLEKDLIQYFDYPVYEVHHEDDSFLPMHGYVYPSDNSA